MEPLLFISATLAIVASMANNSRIARFGLSFYFLFSSLAIFAKGEVLASLVYLATAGVVLAGFVAYLEIRLSMKLSHNGLAIKLGFLAILCMIGTFTITYMAFKNFIYSISLSIAVVAATAIASRNLMRITIGLVTLESAFILVLTEIGWFTTMTSIPMCLFMLISGLGLPYALSRRMLN